MKKISLFLIVGFVFFNECSSVENKIRISPNEVIVSEKGIQIKIDE